MNFLIKKLSILFLLFWGSSSVFAQPQLPDIGATAEGGVTILSWINPYQTGIKSIAVQRSADSNYNFTTIGYVSDINGGTQSFVDAYPISGKNWYRLSILFTSDMEWKSSLVKVELDSADIANRMSLPSNDSLQKIIEKMGTSNSISLEQLSNVSIPKSQYVFTNPFTGNINIEIADVHNSQYSLVFFDQKDKEVLRIKSIHEKVVILDKRNFQTKGIFKFKLYKNNEEFEHGLVNIY